MPGRPSSWLKVDRAVEHYEAVRTDLRAFREERPYRPITSHNADFTKHWLAVEFDRPDDFTRWGLMYGDCVHNLRSALDHVVYEAAVHESGTDPPAAWKRLMFPIVATEADFRSQELGRLTTLSATVRDLIESRQPYNRTGQPIDRTFLLRLHDSDIEDKHRQLRLVATHLEEGKTMVNLEGGQQIHFEQVDGPLRSGTPFLTFTHTTPWPELQMTSATVTVDVALEGRFADRDGPEWLDPLKVLMGFKAEVVRALRLLGPHAGHNVPAP